MNVALADLAACVGRTLGPTEWLTIDQDRMNRFVAATGSLDYLTLSLTNYFLPQLLEVSGISSGVNYGAESARFGSHPMAGQRVRGVAEVVTATAIEGGAQTVIRITVELEGASEPTCVVDSVSRWMA